MGQCKAASYNTKLLSFCLETSVYSLLSIAHACTLSCNVWQNQPMSCAKPTLRSVFPVRFKITAGHQRLLHGRIKACVLLVLPPLALPAVYRATHLSFNSVCALLIRAHARYIRRGFCTSVHSFPCRYTIPVLDSKWKAFNTNSEVILISSIESVEYYLAQPID